MSRNALRAPDLPTLLGAVRGLNCMELSALGMAMSSRLAELAGKTAAEEEDRFVTAQEAAPLLGFSVWWIYKHRHELPFAGRVGGHYKFSVNGMRAWKRGRLGA